MSAPGDLPSDSQPSTSTGPNWFRLGLAIAWAGTAGLLAGWPGGLLTAVTGWRVLRSANPVWGLAGLGFGLLWVGAGAWTGNRTLFFPFAFWLATLAFVVESSSRYWTAVLQAGGILTLFFLIRWQQGASLRVLWIELLVTVTLAGFAIVCDGNLPPSRFRGALIAAVISGLAYLSLLV